MIIEKATLSDAESVHRITSKCGKALEAVGVYQWNEEYPSLDKIKQDITGNTVFRGTVDGEIIAIITINEDQDDEYEALKWDSPGPFAVIHRLAVDPVCQGKGLAREMMSFAEGWCLENEYKSIRLDTYIANDRNMDFYTKRGYTAKGEITLAYKKREFMCFELILSQK